MTLLQQPTEPLKSLKAGRSPAMIILSIAGLQRVLADYVAYYMTTRTHLSLAKDAAASRPVTPPTAGRIVESPQVDGLHHRYDGAAA